MQSEPITKDFFGGRTKQVYAYGIKDTLKLSLWKPAFKLNGLSLYDEGRNSLITRSVFKLVKARLSLQRIQAFNSTIADQQKLYRARQIAKVK